MTRKHAAVAAALAALALAFWLAYPRSAPPNVLLVTIDTLRWDRLGAYGYAAAATPVLDGLARRGVRVLLSNSVAWSVTRLYEGNKEATDAGLQTWRFPARRAVNSRPDRRGVVEELVVSNVPPRPPSA